MAALMKRVCVRCGQLRLVAQFLFSGAVCHDCLGHEDDAA